jgi:hypothetical protein
LLQGGEGESGWGLEEKKKRRIASNLVVSKSLN